MGLDGGLFMFEKAVSALTTRLESVLSSVNKKDFDQAIVSLRLAADIVENLRNLTKTELALHAACSSTIPKGGIVR
jgi:hypothetical protein